ncbi:uncharacterized protein PADG_02441 [Paracoccidioides brasiliensis Pb18]|uniref:Uncharacterized protein n=1 Tax=Paracoccidioides brasiliensis (strain Pb18) TaxID=502780 RepID=C1G5I6_PARBD|nr:uncharacterized protein PADG_02441 [Paracoccidioides brasiliensis Pb18]EEH46343.2 hypothetical protein PADG_02441 [Paracoccidioides brasiliensis Pb18]
MRSIPKNHKRPGQNGSTKMLGCSNSNILPLETSVNETGSVRKASQELGHNLESWKVKKFSLTIAPTPQREEGKGNIGATLKPSLTRPIVEGEDRVKISFGQIVRKHRCLPLVRPPPKVEAEIWGIRKRDRIFNTRGPTTCKQASKVRIQASIFPPPIASSTVRSSSLGAGSLSITSGG